MSLIKNHTTGHGVVCADAYIRIKDFRGNAEQITFTIGVWLNYDSFLSGKSFLEEYRYTVPFQDGMGMTQLYQYLQTLPAWSDAVDFVEPEPLTGSPPTGSPAL